MKYKFLSIDLDGTLLSRTKKITKENYRALFEFKQKAQTKLILNTGRPLHVTKDFAKLIKDNSGTHVDYLIAYNGAVVYETKSKKCHEQLISSEVARKIYSKLWDKNCVLWFYTKHKTDNNVKEVLTNKLYLKKFFDKTRNIDLTLINHDQQKSVDFTSYKINIYCKNNKVTEEIAKLLKKNFSEKINVTQTGKNLFEINAKLVNKGYGIKKIQELTKSTKELWCHMGDSGNDIDGFKQSALKIAFHTSNKKIIEACDFYINSKTSAVAIAIKRYLLPNTLINENIKLVVSDLDGTFLAKDKKIHPETKDAITRVVKQHNKKFVISTGRGMLDCLDIFKYLELDNGYIISNNGAVVYDVQKKKYLRKDYFTHEQTKEIFAFVTKTIKKLGNKAGLFIYDQDNNCDVWNKKGFWDALYGSGKKQPAGVDPWKNYEIKSFESISDGKQTSKFVIFFSKEEDCNKAKEIFKKEFPDFELTCSMPRSIEINKMNISKGDALKLICKKENVTTKQCLICGDEENDISMLKLSNYSFCPENSKEIVKRCCSYHMVEESSLFVARAIQQSILFEMKEGTTKPNGK